MKLLQINTTVNSGSTGRIAEGIGKLLIARGHQSYIASGRGNRLSTSSLIKVGNKWDQKMHALQTRLFDRHGFGSRAATASLIRKIDRINPDVIHLHNIHGYYLNIRELFNYLRLAGKPVVWTLHDCWPFTGHCCYFDFVNCFKWKTQCYACPNKRAYPASWWKDNSKENYQDKRKIFNGLPRLNIVTPSQWLAGHVKNSFLGSYPVHLIHNGIDINLFSPRNADEIRRKYHLEGVRILLGVAGTWKKRKAFEDFVRLSGKISKKEVIFLVGLNKKQRNELPPNMVGIARTENLEELAALYSAADVFVNPTYVENFPTTHLEALACGTPVITYSAGGSPETIDESTGLVVEKGNIEGLNSAIAKILGKGKAQYSKPCRERAEKLFNAQDRFGDYLALYKSLLRV